MPEVTGKVEVVGHRVLIEPEHYETEVEEGALKGFKMDVGEDWKRERAATTIGTIRSVGPMAWRAFDRSEKDWKPWAAVGDKVYYAKYAGKSLSIDDTQYIVCNDEDIIAIVHEEKKDV